MAERLAAVWLPILPETSKIAPELSKALRGSEKQAGKSGQSMGGKLSAGIGSALKKSAIGVGVTAGAAIGVGLTKGLGRLNGIEQAEASLRGLGHSASGVGSIMSNALASVKGTAFGLEEAGTAAAGAVAAGIKPGQDLERTLKIMGDTATIAKASLTDMGAIFNSVAARGKLQGDDMLQLLSRGVPVLQHLGDELGKTSGEISDMVRKGEINFEMFQSAMERGMSGAALEAGKTVQGSFKNMGAAAGRLGATIAGPFFRQAAGGFAGVTAALDVMNDRVKPVMEDVEAWIIGKAIPAFKDFAVEGKSAWDALSQSQDVRKIVSGAVDALEAMGVVVKGLTPSVVSLLGSLSKAGKSLGISTWDVFTSLLQSSAVILDATLVPALEAVASLAENNQGAVTALVAAWMAFKTVPGVLGKVSPVLDKMRFQVGYAGLAIADAGTKTKAFGSQMGTAFTTAGGGMRGFGASVKTGMGQAVTGVKAGVGGVVSALGGPWTLAFVAATAVVMSFVDNMRRQESMQKAVEKQSLLTGQAAKTMYEAIIEGASRLDAAEKATEDIVGTIEDLGNSGPNALSRLNTGLGELVPHLTSLGQAQQSVAEHNRDLADTAKEATGVIDKLGLSNRDLAAAAMGAKGAYDDMREKLMENGRGGEYLADKLQELRRSFQEAEVAAQRLGPAGATVSSALKDVAERAGTAESRADKLRLAFMELAGIEVSSAEASANLTNTISGMTSKMEDFSGATLKVSGGLETATPAGAALHDALMELGKDMQRAVTAGEPAADVFDRSSDALEQMRQSAGVSKEAWSKLLEQMGMTPDRMTVVAEFQDDAMLAEMSVLQSKLGEFKGKPLTITTQINDAGAQKKLEEMGFKLKNMDEFGNVDIVVNDQAAIDELNRFIAGEMPKVDGKVLRANAFLNADSLLATNDFAAAQLATLNLRRPTPLASMNISQLDAKHIEALQKVNLLDGKRPTPDARLNIDQLTADQQMALAQIFVLDAQNPTAIADLTDAQLKDKAEKAIELLKEVDTSKPNPKITAETQDAMNKLGGVKDLLAKLQDKTVRVNVVRTESTSSTGGRASGGRGIPGHATGARHSGYRLPHSGPGTEVTDGFLAFDRHGVPAARLDADEWVINGKSSEKYDKELAQINAGTFPKLPGYAKGRNPSGDTGEKSESESEVFDDILNGAEMPTADEFLRFARGEMVRGFQASRSLQGAPYVFGGSDWGDCSATSSAFAAFALGIDPFPRKYATGDQEQWLRANGFHMGIGPVDAFRTAWVNGGPGGGHTSSQLPGGLAVEMGGGAGGQGKIGNGAAPVTDPQFTHHAWIEASKTRSGGAVGSTTSGGDKDLVPLDGEAAEAAETVTEAQNDPNSIFYGTGANSWSDLGGNLAKAAVGGQIAAALSVLDIPDELPPLIKAGQTWFMQRDEEKKQAESEKDLVSAADSLSAADESANDTEAEPVPDPEETKAERTKRVKDAVKRALAGRGWDKGKQWSGINFLVGKSSDWNPNAVNSATGAFGLFQLGTEDTQKYLPDRSQDPGKQADAGANYIADNYGTPEKAKEFWEENQYFDRGGVARGKGYLPKDVVEPERVLSPKQTRAFEELVFGQLPQLSGMASAATSGAINVGAGMAGAAANAVLPGSGAVVQGVAAPVAEMAGWYAGQVTEGLQTTVEDFGRDMLSIPTSMIDSVFGELTAQDAPSVPTALPSVPAFIPKIDRSSHSEGGQMVNNFNGYPEDWAWQKFRRLESEKIGGRVGARRA